MRPRRAWLGRVLGMLLFVAIVGGLLAVFVLPTTLPFRDRQLLTFTCDASGSIELCDQPDTVARFFVEVCGRGDVTLSIDQSRFRRRLASFELVAADFTVFCQSRLVAKEGIATLEQRSFPYLEQDDQTARLYEAWKRGEVTVAEAREQLLVTP